MLKSVRTGIAVAFLFTSLAAAGGLILNIFQPQMLEFTMNRSTGIIILAGLLVGFGARLGNGCTSGHGVCGIGRLAPRSMVAAVTFIVAGSVTAIVINHVFGGSI